MDAAFDRVIINTRERPVSSDINQLQSENSRTLREVLRAIFLQHALDPALASTGFTPQSGFLGDAMFCSAAGGMAVSLAAGLGLIYDSGSTATAIGGLTGLDDRSPFYPVYLSAPQSLTVPAAPASGQERYDIIEVALDRRQQDSASRDVLDPVNGVFNPTSVLKALSYLLDGRTGQVTSPANSTTGIGYKVGAVASTGAAQIPATSPGYTRVAVIYVAGAVSSIAQNAIRDDRQLLSPEGKAHAAFRVTQTPGSPDTVAVTQPPAAPAGYRFAVQALGSSGAGVRVYVFGGKMGNAQVLPTIHCKGSTLALANRLPRATNPTYYAGGANSTPTTGGVDATLQSTLAGLADPIQVAIGQPYATFDMDSSRTIDSGDSVDSTRWYDVELAITTH